MGKKTMKSAALVAIFGMVFQFGGCLGNQFWRSALLGTVGYSTLELVLDNDNVFDLFEGGATGVNL